ncbi:hypothetical protein AB833_21290 [Chromatiales bacterium (ex Bugula neritina AB1)]|nr:hypothetical protein AB833_21290 [Chromatiales bacterium (ex Bugula neritina AB1)]
MFEFDQYRAPEFTPAIRPVEKIEYASGIKKRSLLIWSEHCVECAAPECYQTCSLYQPRPDERCRRFEVGMRRNNYFRGVTGGAAEIVFGQWGKLEARGNTLLYPNSLVSFVEAVVPRVQPLVNAFGRLVRRFGGSPPWTSLAFELLDYTSRKMHKASHGGEKPHGFLIEIFNPEEQIVKIKFSCSVTRSKMLAIPANGKLALPFWKQLVLQPGYNRFFIDYSDLTAVVESGFRYNLSFTPDAESGTRLVFISQSFVTTSNTTFKDPRTIGLSNQKAAQEAPAKCVVFDLDNTLWDGVLVEGDVTLKPGVQALFKELDKRGILISVASKNNEQEALERLTTFGLAEYITYPVINWNLKSENIKRLADKISIGTDSLVFIDDSPFEREEVASAVAGIEVLLETKLDTLLEHPRLQGSGTAESGNRRIMYQQQKQRSEAAIEFGEDYLAFLKACDIVVSIGLIQESHTNRVTELLQRTNQLNFSGTKYPEDAVTRLLEDSTTEKHVIHCRDKYGEYGLVGFAITRREEDKIVVQDFMLSCRVQGKLIEKAFFSYLVDTLSNGTATLNVNFVATDRNALAKSVLDEIGFSLDNTGYATLHCKPGDLEVDFLEVIVAESALQKSAHVME